MIRLIGDISNFDSFLYFFKNNYSDNSKYEILEIDILFNEFIIRTSVTEAIARVCDRFSKRDHNAILDEIEAHKTKNIQLMSHIKI